MENRILSNSQKEVIKQNDMLNKSYEVLENDENETLNKSEE
jgi:hypothetical protein